MTQSFDAAMQAFAPRLPLAVAFSGGADSTALLLAYTPASLRFRSIGARPTGERGSVYYACKLLRPAAPQPVYLPEALQPLVLPRAHDIGLPLQPQPLPAAPLQGSTDLQVQAEPALNAAFLTLRHAGADLAPVLRRTLRQLCRAHIDVVYLSLDLGQRATGAACTEALGLGFIAAGLTPFMPWPDLTASRRSLPSPFRPDPLLAVSFSSLLRPLNPD